MPLGLVEREKSMYKGKVVQHRRESVGGSSNHEFAAESECTTENEAGGLGLPLNSHGPSLILTPGARVTLHSDLPPFALRMPLIRTVMKEMLWETR